jgi:integrase
MNTIPDARESRGAIEGNFMAQHKPKRQSGTGSIVREKLGLAIRWPEYVLLDTGERKRKMRYEFLGPVSEREAGSRLIDRVAQTRHDPPKLARLPLTFKEHAARWERDMLASAGADAADLYKFSVRSVRSGVIRSRLEPRFGAVALQDISTESIQEWVTSLRKESLAASTIHNYVKILRVILAAAVKWKSLDESPAEGVELPKLPRKGKRKKWALTAKQAGQLLGKIVARKPRTMVALAITAGLRRGELIAARWKHLDEGVSAIAVMEASYRGHIDTPKTDAGIRTVPLDPYTMNLLAEWRRLSKHTRPEDFIFATRTGQQESPGNILRRHVWPACQDVDFPRPSWNTFRRTFSTLLHKEAIPAKTIAEMMGHTDVDTQFIYIQSEDAMKRVAATKIGDELSRYAVQNDQMGLPWLN